MNSKPCSLTESEVRYWSGVVHHNHSQIVLLEEICKQADWNYGEVVNWLRAQYRGEKIENRATNTMAVQD